MKRTAAVLDSDRAATALTEAVRRVGQFWDLTNGQLGLILGLSAPTVSRMRNNGWTFEPRTKPFELAQYLVRLFRSLDSFMGSNDEASRAWLTSPNSDLEARPIDLIGTVGGLVEVCDYVDGFRART